MCSCQTPQVKKRVYRNEMGRLVTRSSDGTQEVPADNIGAATGLQIIPDEIQTTSTFKVDIGTLIGIAVTIIVITAAVYTIRKK